MFNRIFIQLMAYNYDQRQQSTTRSSSDQIDEKYLCSVFQRYAFLFCYLDLSMGSVQSL